MEETSSSVMTGVVAVPVRADVDKRIPELGERRVATLTRAVPLALYKDLPESSIVLVWFPDKALVVAAITVLFAVPTRALRAVTGFAVCAPRAVTLAREVVEAGLFTTLLVRAVRETVPRAVFVVVRGDVATAREDVFVRADAEFAADDIARDALVERFIVLRCVTFGCAMVFSSASKSFSSSANISSVYSTISS